MTALVHGREEEFCQWAIRAESVVVAGGFVVVAGGFVVVAVCQWLQLRSESDES